jgi:hypothetical protein
MTCCTARDAAQAIGLACCSLEKVHISFVSGHLVRVPVMPEIRAISDSFSDTLIHEHRSDGCISDLDT